MHEIALPFAITITILVAYFFFFYEKKPLFSTEFNCIYDASNRNEELHYHYEYGIKIN